MVRMLLDFKIVPIIVFDGAEMPLKADVNTGRRKYALDRLVYKHRHMSTFRLTFALNHQLRRLRAENKAAGLRLFDQVDRMDIVRMYALHA